MTVVAVVLVSAAALAVPGAPAPPGPVGTPGTSAAATGSVAAGAAHTPAALAAPGVPAVSAGAAAATAPGGPGAVAGGPFVDLREVDPTVGREMRYAGARNFTGGPVDGYEEPVCLLARPAALALRRAQRGLLGRGYSLKVYDCYRPQRAVDRFARWALEPEDPRVRAEFHPRVPKSELFARGYIAARSGHSRGSTVDVTLVRVPRGPAAGVPGGGGGSCFGEPAVRSADDSVDMGTAYDCFDPLARTDSPDPRIGAEQRRHRKLLAAALAAQGFVNLPEEWWHFTLRPEAYPDRYFDLPVRGRRAGAAGGGLAGGGGPVADF
jgi:D-alanyl-D-alanine dipeptidase